MAIQDYLQGINDYTGGYKEDVNKATQAYAGASGAASTLPFKLKEALNTKLNNNKDIIEQQNSALGDYIAAPATARAKYQDIWNPFEREKLVATARSQAFQPYATYSDVLSNRMGQVSDIVGQGVSGWQGVVQQAQALAQLAQSRLSQAMGEYTSAAQMQQQSDAAAQAKAQYEQTFNEGKRQFDLNFNKKTGGSGGGTGIPGVGKADQLTAETWMEMVSQTKGDPDAIWNMIARDKGALSASGVNVQNLWNWQAELKNRMTPQATPTSTTSGPSWLQNFFSALAPKGGGLPVKGTPEYSAQSTTPLADPTIPLRTIWDTISQYKAPGEGLYGATYDPSKNWVK